MKHSIFSASAAERWSNCPGSIPFAAGIPNKESEASREGTAGHALGDALLKQGGDPYGYVGIEFEGYEITDDLADAVQTYVEYVRGFSGVRLSEQRVYYARLLGVDEEEAFGTSDVIIVDGTIVHVMDAKFGRRFVDPRDNKQMILYGAAAVDALEAVGEEVTEIHLHIIQPRVTAKPVPFVMTRQELADAVELLRQAAQRVVEAQFNYVPGIRAWEEKYLIPGEYQCQWCPAAAACPSLRLRAKSTTPIDEFDPVNSLESMTGTTVSENMALVPLLELWIKAVEHEGFRRLTRGDQVPGFKLVKGREGNRKWTDPDAVKIAFGEDNVIFKEPELKTPPQLEKALKGDKRKSMIDTLVSRSPARPTVTTSDDPREPWTEAAGADEFGVIE